MSKAYEAFDTRGRIVTDFAFVQRCFELTCNVYGVDFVDVMKNNRVPTFPEVRYCVYTFLTEYRGWKSERVSEALQYTVNPSTIRHGIEAYYKLAETHPETMERMRESWGKMKAIETLPSIENIDMSRHEHG